MKVGEYKIKWLHENNHQYHGESKGKLSRRFPHVKQPSLTTCYIYQGETMIGKGIAVCKVGDNFNKTRGRKKSLKRALSNTDLTKEVRTVFWNEFLK